MSDEDDRVEDNLLETDDDSENEDDFLSDSDSEQDMDEVDDGGESGQNGSGANVIRKTYVPTGDEEESNMELECDDSAYILYQKAETGYPCLSFDIIKDDLGSGEERASTYPVSFSMVSGTQGPKVHVNSLLVIRMSNLHRNKEEKEKKKRKRKDSGQAEDDEDDEDDQSSEEEEDESEKEPQFQCAQVQHNGCVNRVRSTVLGNKVVAASWSELAKVHIWDLSKQVQAINDEEAMKVYTSSKANGETSTSPLYTFTGHQQEGFALDWSSVTQGLLASGDCSKNIHIWKPADALCTWHVDQTPLPGHTKSVEDLQWSPNESNVLASCSVDKTIRVWDIRSRPSSACVITVPDAHESDVNVISWNRKDPAFLLSGGDEGAIKTWDLRQFASAASKEPKPIATFKHHTSAITSIEWHPTDSTVFAASGADHQLTLWDLAVEKDDEEEEEEEMKEEEPAVRDLPPQLLFIHQGQKDVKELHWHQQIPGLIVSTASTGIDIFRSISV